MGVGLLHRKNMAKLLDFFLFFLTSRPSICNRKGCKAACMNELHSAVSKSVFLFINNTMTWQVFFLPLGPFGSGVFARTTRCHTHNYYSDEGAQFEILPLCRSAKVFCIIIYFLQQKEERKEMQTHHQVSVVALSITQHCRLTRWLRVRDRMFCFNRFSRDC